MNPCIPLSAPGRVAAPMRWARVAALSALLALPLAAPAAEPMRFAWPEGRRAAVSLAYDDALDSQLDHALPALDRHGFKASFYLQLSRPSVRERLADWRAAARGGHELGNHSLFHQCSGKGPDRDWVAPEHDLDATPASRMRDEVLLANAMLHAIDGETERTYTVPCGDAMAADGNYLDLVAPAFVAIKYGDGAVTPDMDALDPYAVTVEAPVAASAEDLIAHVEAAARAGTMVNLTFHGIGGDYLSVSPEAHEGLLAYLDRHRDLYWVDSFIQIMRYVREQQARPAAEAGGAPAAAIPDRVQRRRDEAPDSRLRLPTALRRAGASAALPTPSQSAASLPQASR
ncbi:polysaccharide deacetylase family protein [Marilutibacter spongiae]|nr:polysaccharide deacetylase family protein [Lysobacter spongiae]